MIILLKTAKALFSVVKFLGYAIALPIAVPTFAIFEVISTIDMKLNSKIKEIENGKRL